MKLSIYPEHKDAFMNWLQNPNAKIFLNGKRMHNVVFASDALGTVIRLQTDANGGVLLTPDGDDILKETLTGNVTIQL